jgi:uncharacterized protein
VPRAIATSTTDIAFESKGRRIAGRLYSPAEPSGRAILFIHGLHSTQAGYGPRAEAAGAGLGATSLSFDLSGHGESEGDKHSITLREHLAETLMAYDTLCAAAAVDPTRMGVCGASYGGYLAALLADVRAPKRVLIRAPALYPDDWLDLPLGSRRDRPEAPHSHALEAMSRFGGEVLVLESEHDEVVPAAAVRAYVAAAPNVRHEVLAGAGHRLDEPACEAAFVRWLLEWFRPL